MYFISLSNLESVGTDREEIFVNAYIAKMGKELPFISSSFHRLRFEFSAFD